MKNRKIFLTKYVLDVDAPLKMFFENNPQVYKCVPEGRRIHVLKDGQTENMLDNLAGLTVPKVQLVPIFGSTFVEHEEVFAAYPLPITCG